MSAPTVESLLGDLDAERAAVMSLVREAPRASWTLPTRAEPWTVRDQIAHLGWFDGAFARAISTPAEFEAERDAVTDVASYVAKTLREVPDAGPAALAYWQDAARAFDRAAVALQASDPQARLPWYGPAMSLRSAITSRIMETWAHGTDVADAVGARLAPTDRLRHVADIAVRARAQGYRVRDRAVPQTPVLVSLTGPGGAEWRWGDVSGVASQTLDVRSGEHADRATQTDADRIAGDAEEFCLVLVRRVHVDDTNLEITGAAAREWMEIGQAFAGTPGKDPVRT